MIPKEGDKVKLNDKFVQEFVTRAPHASDWIAKFRGKIIEVVKSQIGFNFQLETEVNVYITDGSLTQCVTLTEDGFYPYFTSSEIPVFDIVEAFKDIPDEDKCKQCGGKGTIIRTCCMCMECGSLIWGF